MGTRAVQRDFLPPALAVCEAPPSPLGRALLCVLVALLAAAVIWACVAELDIVVTSPGRIIPSGRVKTVQARDPGTVAEIHVREGQSVSRGQPLIRLEPTYANAEQLRLRRQLDEVGLQQSWRAEYDLWLAGARIAGTPLPPPVISLAGPAGRAQTLYRRHRAELGGRLQAINREHGSTLADIAVARAEQRKLESTLSVLGERLAAHKSLVDKQYGARLQYLELLQSKTELVGSIAVSQAREHRLEETAAAVGARSRAMLLEERKSNLLELQRLGVERSALEQELRKARETGRHLVIRSPVDGTVQELAVHARGGVVAPAQVLMKVVPAGVAIEVEALLQNRDVGFVQPGQAAAVKVDTFNFTKYGLVAAEVVDVGSDAVEDPRLGWAFRMRLKLERDWMKVEGREVALGPGMSVTAEIMTGRRRLIEYFLSPLLRYRHDSVRER